MVPFSMHQMSPPLKVHMSVLVDMLELNTSPLHMVHTLPILGSSLQAIKKIVVIICQLTPLNPSMVPHHIYLELVLWMEHE
jgi:hypothetical protein